MISDADPRHEPVHPAELPDSPSSPESRERLLRQYRARIEQARVYDVAVVTALEEAPKLSARLGNRLLLKREDQQSVYSF